MEASPSDVALLAAVGQRDLDAMRALYDRHAAWLWGIAIRRLVSRLRRRPDVAAFTGPAGTVPAAEDQVLLSVEYGDLGQALARLSPEMRAVIQATVLDGLTAAEDARLLRMPVGSVKTRLYRAKAHLRAALAEGLS